MAATLKVNAGEALERVSLDIRIVGLRVARFRLWLAAQIIKFAGRIAGCDVRVQHGREFDELPPLPRTRNYSLVGDVEIPRQASVRWGSPFYTDPSAWGREVDFYLDGVKQEKVVSYDLDAGYIRVFKIGPDGQPFVAGDEIATEIRHGNLEARPAHAEG